MCLKVNDHTNFAMLLQIKYNIGNIKYYNFLTRLDTD